MAGTQHLAIVLLKTQQLKDKKNKTNSNLNETNTASPS